MINTLATYFIIHNFEDQYKNNLHFLKSAIIQILKLIDGGGSQTQKIVHIPIQINEDIQLLILCRLQYCKNKIK